MALGTLSVDITANISKLTKGMNKAKLKVKKFGKSFRKEMSKMTASAKKTASAVAKIGAVGAVGGAVGVQQISHVSSSMADLSREAKRLGMDIEDLQLFQGLGAKVGIEKDAVIDQINDMNVRIGDALLGGGTGKDEFKKLGIDVGKLANMKKVDQLLLLGDALSKVHESTKLFEFEEVFTEEKFASVFEGGTEAIIKYGGELDKFGLISQAQADKFVIINDKVKILENGFNLLYIQLIGRITPSIESFLLSFTKQKNIDSMIDKINLFAQELKRPISILKSLYNAFTLTFSAIRLSMTLVVAYLEVLVNSWSLSFSKMIISFQKYKVSFLTGVNILILGKNKLNESLGIGSKTSLIDVTEDIKGLKKLNSELIISKNNIKKAQLDTKNILLQLSNDTGNKLDDLVKSSTDAFRSDVLTKDSPIVKSGQAKPDEFIKKGSIKPFELGKGSNDFSKLRGFKQRYKNATKTITQDEKDANATIKANKIKSVGETIDETTNINKEAIDNYTSLWNNANTTIFNNLIDHTTAWRDIFKDILKQTAKDFLAFSVITPLSKSLGESTVSAGQSIGTAIATSEVTKAITGLFAKSNSGSQKVTINNYGNDNVQVNETSNGMEVVIAQIVDDITRGNGSISTSLEGRYGLRKV